MARNKKIDGRSREARVAKAEAAARAKAATETVAPVPLDLTEALARPVAPVAEESIELHFANGTRLFFTTGR